MMIANINAGEDHVRYIGQVYQEQYAKLRRYFLIQLGSSSEADERVHETMRRLFFFMEDRDWEAEAEYIPVYLMRIAGFICSRRLAEKRSRSAFNKVRIPVTHAVKESIEFVKTFLRRLGIVGRQPSDSQRLKTIGVI
jgi:DNA-directed RNA polymerase specialized sigma24 family protein